MLRRSARRAYAEALRRSKGLPPRPGREHLIGVWLMAMELAGELNVSPWEALLLEVRRSAWRCTWVDERMTEALRASDGADPQDSPVVRRWLIESRNERRHLARVAKAAIDAGVAERLVRQVELEGRLLVEALEAGLDALGLSTEQRSRALAAAHAQLLAPPAGVETIEGRVVLDEPGSDDDPGP